MRLRKSRPHLYLLLPVCVLLAAPCFALAQADTGGQSEPSGAVPTAEAVPAAKATNATSDTASEVITPPSDPSQIMSGQTRGPLAEYFDGILPESVLTSIDVIYAIWQVELFKSGDTPVRLNQLIIAGLVVLIGIWIARWVTAIVRRRVAALPRVDAYAADLVSRALFYLLAVMILLLGMSVAGIPITVFALLGGALAIGVGFGAQNLCNNLISSVIIMLERPIRKGDIIQVSDSEGKVEEIGNRCTRVRRFDGIDVLVPNSYFLENPVVNWTLSDTSIRAKVTVGVAYGSPTERVARILRNAVEENDKVLKAPYVEVIFEEFGDNALIFDLYFWTSVTTPMDLKRLQSEVRFEIDKECREANITIAFPQRDVHIDGLGPIDVRVQKSGA